MLHDFLAEAKHKHRSVNEKIISRGYKRNKRKDKN